MRFSWKRLFSRQFPWKRTLLYWYAKIVRADGTPEYIGRGWAVGLFVSCALPVGFQTIPALALSFVVRGSKIGAVIGTWVSNPATMLFIYPVQCWIGNQVIRGSLTYDRIEESITLLLKEKSTEAFFNMGMELVISFFVGGLVFALICTPATYFLVRFLVIRYRRAKARLGQKLRHRKEKV